MVSTIGIYRHRFILTAVLFILIVLFVKLALVRVAPHLV